MAILTAMALLSAVPPARSQQLMLANPHWNITLTDYGYSDFLLDNTPGFEGREYLSGEWGAAVGYQFSGGPTVSPKWLEPHFIFPDWTNDSPFQVTSPIAQFGLNADGLPIAQSVIASSELEITLRHEMLDTVVGTPMGTTPASSTNAGTFASSSRYVLKQTCTIRNISGTNLSSVQFFQFLHGLNSQRGVYDNRLHAGALDGFRYDVTMSGVDPWAMGTATAPAGLEDIIGFHASVAPSALEIGYYGIEGNGVDDHGLGKPSDGVHLSIEDNWQTLPYSARQGTDAFAPPQRWVSGAQRWDLGSLPAGQSASIDVILSVLTGTKVPAGTGSSGGCNGGSAIPGGVDYDFDTVSSEGSCFGEYAQADESELAIHIAGGEFEPFDFLTPGGPAQLWELSFDGAFSGTVHLRFGYDPSILPPGFAEDTLCIYQFDGGVWQKLACVVDTVAHTIAANTTSLTVFALGVDAGTVYAVDVAVSPPGSGTVLGGGNYSEGAIATLVAVAGPGYVFTNWTDGGVAISSSPSLTFAVHTGRSLVAHFLSVGGDYRITTIAEPAHGGTTYGDGAYSPGATATVVATASPGYKFSKWLENGVAIGTSRTNTFTVTGDRSLVAKFKPVYVVTATPVPANGGELEVDPFYEPGDLAKLKATPNSGYAFVNWTQNGIPVSADPNFQFTVTGNRDLVGHFALGYRIDVIAEPANAGAAGGGGIYGAGAGVSVSAAANPGYVFLRWEESSAAVSTSPSYDFTASTNRALVAKFIAQPSVSCALDPAGLMTVSWPAGASGWELQECPRLGEESWTSSTLPVSVVGNQKQATVPAGTNDVFFRVVHP